MADTRLTGLLRRLHLGPPSSVGQADLDALRAFVAHKDEAAFAGIVRRHGAMVLRVCRNVLNHTQDAEDACQATFLVLSRKAESVGRGEALASWLHGVAYRTALRARRDAGRRRARERQAPIPDPPDPIEAVAWSDVQVLIQAEIRRLPVRFRAAFVLCFLEGRGRAEAAVELGISENTLSSRLARARDRLKHRLARRGVQLSAVLAALALTEPGESAVPTALIESTSRAATQFAARLPVTGVSNVALQLTNGTIQTMTIAKIKWAAAALALGGTLVVGAWGAGQVPGHETKGSAGGPPGGFQAVKEKPATVDREADYAQRQRSLKNLRNIVLAIHNYHDTMGRLPADLTDPAGKPILSWRVAILPYFEGGDALYKQFKTGESWDSENNLKLLAKLPDFYRVGFEPPGATHTYYQRFAMPGQAEGGLGEEGAGGTGAASGGIGAMPGAGGSAPPAPGLGGPPEGVGGGTGGPPMPGAAGIPGPAGLGSRLANSAPGFPGSFAAIPDGTSNTLGVLEAGPAVPWSKPIDFVYDRTKPLPVLVGPFRNTWNAAMMDGAVYSLRTNLDQATWQSLIDPSDGRVLPAIKTLRARFATDSEDEKKALAKVVEENQRLIAAFEEQLAEHAALLRLTGKVTKDADEADEQQLYLRKMLEMLRPMNQKMRDELGLRPGVKVPGGR